MDLPDRESLGNSQRSSNLQAWTDMQSAGIQASKGGLHAKHHDTGIHQNGSFALCTTSQEKGNTGP